MKNVLLVGDSIRIGYDKAVRKTLEGKANVFFTEDNCRFASYVLRYIHEYIGMIKEGKVDVIHWNAGLWDCLHILGEDAHTPIEFYKYYLDRICARIVKLCPDAKVIFATSTKVQSEKMAEGFKRYNEEIQEYNKAAIEVVSKYGFIVNDLYAVSDDLPEESHSDAVHYYTPMGTEAFANAVLEHICPCLGMEETPKYIEELHTDAPIGY